MGDQVAGVGILAVVAAGVGTCRESADNAVISAGGSARPLLVALRRMPVAARADRENLGGALGSSTSASRVSDDEHSPSALRHSEVASVEYPVSHAIPEFDQRCEERPKVLASMTGEKARNVLEEDEPRSVLSHKVKEGEGKAAALSGESASFAGDAEVLAGEPARPECCSTPILRPFVSTAGAMSCHHPFPFVESLPAFKSNDVTEVGDCGPSLGKDGAGVGVDLGEADGSPAGSFEPKVKAADAGEERGMREFHVMPTPNQGSQR